MTTRPNSRQARLLPTAPSLEHLKKQAKDLRKLHRDQNPEAIPVLKRLHPFKDSSGEEIFAAKLSLNEAQLALALDYGFKSWGELKRHVLGRTDNLKYLHIHCGDSSAGSLRNSSVSGDVHVWREIYIEGAVPGNVPDDEFRRIRAEFLSRSMNLDYDGVLQGTHARYDMLADAAKYGEVILWFDACMYDQTIMIHLIDQCARQQWPDTKLSLICAGEFPGFDAFDGLGQLNPEQLASLLETRHEIKPQEISLAREAWKAFTSANPADIEDILQGDCSPLPYLEAALTRHLQQYPSVRNGLNRTQNQILQAVNDGAAKLGEIFMATREHPAFMGDGSCWTVIEQMAECKVPLVRIDGPGTFRDFMEPDEIGTPTLKDIKRWDVSITDAGKKVLAGRQDFIKLNGIDRWLGGVHLQGTEAQWRWDEDSQRLVKTSDSKATDASFVNDKTDDRLIPVIMKSTEPANLLYVEYEGVNAESTGKAIAELTAFINANDLTKVGHVTCVYPPESSPTENITAQIPVAEIVQQTTGRIRFKQEPAVKVASIFWRRSSGDIHRSLDMLRETIQEQGREPVEFEGFRQVYHNSPFSDDPLAELQIRVGRPVKQKNSSTKKTKAEASSNTRIMYVELKTHAGGHDDRGPAWIARVRFSKTGKTIYYRGKALQRTKGPVGCGNFVDAETGDEYWVSGPKKNGEDRHWGLGSPVHIDEDVRQEYWTEIREQPEKLDKKTT